LISLNSESTLHTAALLLNGRSYRRGEASSPPPHTTTVSPTTPYFFPVSLPNPVLHSTYVVVLLILLIHIIRSNWNFGELAQRSIQYRLRVYSNKNIQQSDDMHINSLSYSTNLAVKSFFLIRRE
jgi:hypothetical protein